MLSLLARQPPAAECLGPQADRETTQSPGAVPAPRPAGAAPAALRDQLDARPVEQPTSRPTIAFSPHPPIHETGILRPGPQALGHQARILQLPFKLAEVLRGRRPAEQFEGLRSLTLPEFGRRLDQAALRITARKPTVTKTSAVRGTARPLELEIQKRIERLGEHDHQGAAEQRLHDQGLRPGDGLRPVVACTGQATMSAPRAIRINDPCV